MYTAMAAVEPKCTEVVFEETVVFETDLQVDLIAVVVVEGVYEYC